MNTCKNQERKKERGKKERKKERKNNNKVKHIQTEERNIGKNAGRKCEKRRNNEGKRNLHKASSLDRIKMTKNQLEFD